MAIKVSGTTVIDDSRNILSAANINSTGVTTSSGGFVGNITGNATGLSNTPNVTVGIVTATSIVVGSAITLSNGGLSISGISTFLSTVVFNSNAAEKTNIVAGAINSNTNIDLQTAAIYLFTSNSSSTWTPNFRFSSTTSLNSVMRVGESVTAALISAQNNTGYYSASTNVDGALRTTYWGGALTPTSGGGSGYDMYTYTITKTGSNTFLVFATTSKFA